jgi:hypothetical protein
MFRLLIPALSLVLWLAAPERARAQAADRATAPTPAAVAIPDSVRKQVGYYHLEGTLIGGLFGGLIGVGIGSALDGECSDCLSQDNSVAESGLLAAGAGAILGFLIGVSSPKRKWVPVSP